MRTAASKSASVNSVSLDAFAKDSLEVRLFSTVTTVGSPRDITAQELRSECFIPADDASEGVIASIAGAAG